MLGQWSITNHQSLFWYLAGYCCLHVSSIVSHIYNTTSIHCKRLQNTLHHHLCVVPSPALRPEWESAWPNQHRWSGWSLWYGNMVPVICFLTVLFLPVMQMNPSLTSYTTVNKKQAFGPGLHVSLRVFFGFQQQVHHPKGRSLMPKFHYTYLAQKMLKTSSMTKISTFLSLSQTCLRRRRQDRSISTCSDIDLSCLRHVSDIFAADQ